MTNLDMLEHKNVGEESKSRIDPSTPAEWCQNAAASYEG